MKSIRYAKWRSRFSKLKFLVREGANDTFSKEKLKILFSPMPEWEPVIRAGFKFTRHQITFAELSEANIAAADLVIPLTVPEIRAVQNQRESFVKNALPLPSLEAIEICDDKYLFHNRLTSLGFEEYLPPVNGTPGFPYLLKKKIAEYGADIHLVTGPAEEQALAHLVPDPAYFCQTIIPGRYEYATHIVLRAGKIACSLEIKYEFSEEIPIKGVSRIVNTSLIRCRHLELFTRILNGIGYEGICCFNYKELAGKPYIFEINPRFGGSLSPYFYYFVRKLNQRTL